MPSDRNTLKDERLPTEAIEAFITFARMTNDILFSQRRQIYRGMAAANSESLLRVYEKAEGIFQRLATLVVSLAPEANRDCGRRRATWYWVDFLQITLIVVFMVDQ